MKHFSNTSDTRKKKYSLKKTKFTGCWWKLQYNPQTTVSNIWSLDTNVRETELLIKPSLCVISSLFLIA